MLCHVLFLAMAILRCDAQPTSALYGFWSSLRGAHYPGYPGSTEHSYLLVEHLQQSQWSVYVGTPINTSAAIDWNNLVYFSCQDGQLRVFNISTGIITYKYYTSANGFTSPALGPSGSVFISECAGNGIAGFTNLGPWHTSSIVPGVPTQMSPTLGCLSVNEVYWGGWDSSFQAIDISTGHQVWMHQFSFDIFDSTPVVNQACNIIVGTLDSHVMVFEPYHGDLISTFAAVGSITASPVIADNNNVYVVTSAGWVYGLLGPYYNTTQFRIELAWAPVGDPTVVGDILIVATAFSMYGFNISDGGWGLWAFYPPSGQICNSPVARPDGIIYVPGCNNTILAVDAVTGVLIRAYQLGFPQFPAAIPAIAGDASVIVGSADGFVYRLCADTCAACDFSHSGAHCENFIPCSVGHGSCSANPGQCSGPTGTGQCPVCFGGWAPPSCLTPSCQVTPSLNLSTAWMLAGSPAIASTGAVFFVTSTQGYVAKLYGWVSALSGASFSSPVLGVNHTLLIRLGDQLYCLSQLTGNTVWTFSLVPNSVGSLTRDSTVAVGPNGAVFVTDVLRLYAINGSTNATLWHATSLSPTTYTPPVYSAAQKPGTVFAAFGEIMTAYIALNGTIRFTFPALDILVAKPAVSFDGFLYLADVSGTVYCIDSSGTELWTIASEGSVTTPLLLINNILYVAFGMTTVSGSSYIMAFNVTVRATLPSVIWVCNLVDNDVVISSLTLSADGMLYWSSRLGFFYAHDASTGAFVWRYYIDSSTSPLGGSAIDSAGMIYQTGSGLYAFAPSNQCSACTTETFGPRCVSTVTCVVAHGVCGIGSCSGPNGTGMCDSCAPGFALPDCADCSPGFFGQGCSPVYCDFSTGAGICEYGTCDGLSGSGYCTSCDLFHFGAACLFPVLCNTTNGICSAGVCSGPTGSGGCDSCFGFWAGNDCDNCDMWHFGPWCDSPVQCNLLNGTCGLDACYGVFGNGWCDSCFGHFGGLTCSDCDAQHFGPTCFNQTACPSFHGTCPQGQCSGINGTGECTSCFPGWANDSYPTCDTGTCDVQSQWYTSSHFLGPIRAVLSSDGSYLYAFSSGQVVAFNSSNGFSRFLASMSDPSSNPIFANGLLIIPTQFYLYGLDSNSGVTLWNFPITVDGFNSTPIVLSDGSLIFCDALQLVSLNGTTGELLWNVSVHAAVRTGVTLLPEENFVIGLDSDLFFYSSNGSFLFNLIFEVSIISTPVVDNNGVIYIFDELGNVHAIGADGAGWVTTLLGVSVGPAAFYGEIIYVPASFEIGLAGACLVGLNRTDGSVLSADCFGELDFDSGPVVSPTGRMYLLLSDGYLYALNATTRLFLWRFLVGFPVQGQPVMLDASGDVFAVGELFLARFAASASCAACNSMYWGPDCSSPVSCVTSNGECSPGSCSGPISQGHCTSCDAGWGGPDCDDSCVDGFGPNCTAVTCAVERGGCDYSCYGRYGTGHCSSCESSYFGADCQFDVQCGFGVCNASSCFGPNGSGFCDSCTQGYSMPTCFQCDSAHYGSACQFTVACNFSNGVCGFETCSGFAGTGRCDQCYGNWSGPACSTCSSDHYGPSCSSATTCDTSNGDCFTGCFGPTGNGHCTVCYTQLWWGPDCDRPAPVGCTSCESGNGLCSGTLGTGICSFCNSTRWGPHCDRDVACQHASCGPGTCYGPTGNGSCSAPCYNGWTGLDCSTSVLPLSSSSASSAPSSTTSFVSSSASVMTSSSSIPYSTVITSSLSSASFESSSTAQSSFTSWYSSSLSSTGPSSSSGSSTASAAPVLLRVVSCEFDSSALAITTVFSQATNIFGSIPPRLHSAFACSLVITPQVVASLPVLGTTPSCQWSALDTLVITLSPNSPLAPGSSILFIPAAQTSLTTYKGITSSDGATPFSGGNVVVSPPASPPIPVVSITAPQSVPLCAPVALDATQSTGLTRMSSVGWTWLWASSDASGGVAETAQLNDQLQAANEMPSLQGLYLQLNSTALTPSATYTLVLTITNIFSLSGSASVTISKSDLNTPSLTIVGPSTTFPSVSTSLLALLTFPCAAAQGPYAFQWTQTTGPSLSLAASSWAKSILVIPSFNLQAGFTYGFEVSVSPVGISDAVVPLLADAAFLAEASPIVAVVSPSSNGLVCICSPLVLNAGASFDPDVSPSQRLSSSFSFNWTCTISPLGASCPFMATMDTSSPVLSIPANTMLANTSYVFAVAVTDGVRESSSSVQYATTDMAMLNVNIQQQNGAIDNTVSSSNAVRLSATVFEPGSSAALASSQIASYSWSQATSDPDLLNFLNPSVVLTASNSPFLTISSGSLTPGLSYTLQLSVMSAGGVTGFGEITLNVSPAPYSLVFPSLSVTPDQTFATIVTISATGFVEPNGGPLQFSFSALDVDTLVTYQLSAVIASSRIPTLLPSGRLNVSAIVYSTSGAQAASSIIQVIVAPLTSTDQAVLAVCQVFNITVTTLQATVWAQDESGAVSLIALLSSALNSTATEQDPSFMCPGVGLNVSAVNAILTTTLTSLLNLEAQGLLDSGTIDANSGVAVSQITSSLSLLTANGSLSNSSVVAAISTINSVAGIVSAISGSSANANVTSIVSTTVNVVGNVLTADPCADFGSLSTALQQILVSSTQNANPSEPPLSVSSSQGTVNASVVPTTSSNSQTLGPASVPDLSAATNFSSGQLSVIQFSSSVGSCLPSNGSLDVNSTIVSIVVTNGSSGAISVHGLPSSTPVSISFGQGATCNQACGWYNPSSLSWSTEGCSISSSLSTGNLTVCQCTHLTEFALLLDALETGCNVFSSTMIVEFHVFAALFAALFAIATVQMIRGILVRVRTKCQCSLMHFEHAVVMAVSALRFCLSLYRSEYLAYHSFSVDQLVIEELLVAAGFCLTFIGSSYMVASWASLVHFSMDRANPFDGLRKIFSVAIFLQIAVVIALLISLPVAAISSSVGVATSIAQAGAAIMGIIAIVFCCLFFRYGVSLNNILKGGGGATVDKGTCTPGRRILLSGFAFALAYFGEAVVWLFSVFDTSASAEVVYGLLDGFNVADLACLLLVFASGTSRAGTKQSAHSHSMNNSQQSQARSQQKPASPSQPLRNGATADSSAAAVELQVTSVTSARSSTSPPPVPRNVLRTSAPQADAAPYAAGSSPFSE